MPEAPFCQGKAHFVPAAVWQRAARASVMLVEHRQERTTAEQQQPSGHTKHHKSHVNNLNKLFPPFRREGRCALSPPGKAERMQLLSTPLKKLCTAASLSHRGLGATSHLLLPAQPLPFSLLRGRGQTQTPTASTWAEWDREGSAPGETSQLGNELCWPAEQWERMAELETPGGAEQAKHSSREWTGASVGGVQRKEHLRETGTAARSSQKHRMDWLGRDLKDHLLPPPWHEQGHHELTKSSKIYRSEQAQVCQRKGWEKAFFSSSHPL